MIKIKCAVEGCKKEVVTTICFLEHKGGSGAWFRHVCEEHRDTYLSKKWQSEYIGRAWEDKALFKNLSQYFERDKEYFRKKGLLL